MWQWSKSLILAGSWNLNTNSNKTTHHPSFTCHQHSQKASHPNLTTVTKTSTTAIHPQPLPHHCNPPSLLLFKHRPAVLLFRGSPCLLPYVCLFSPNLSFHDISKLKSLTPCFPLICIAIHIPLCSLYFSFFIRLLIFVIECLTFLQFSNKHCQDSICKYNSEIPFL